MSLIPLAFDHFQNHPPTPLQEEVFSFIAQGRGNAVINAVAGSGKTTTIVASIVKLPDLGSQKVLMVAYNRHIADELAQKQSQGLIPSHVHIYTLHAIGLKLISQHNGGRRPQVDDNYKKNLKANIQDYAFQQGWFAGINPEAMDRSQFAWVNQYVSILSQLVTQAKHSLSLKVEDLIPVVEAMELYHVSDLEMERAIDILWAFYLRHPLHQIEIITYDDMIFFPALGLVNVNPFHQYDVVYVDECQDLNKAQQRLVKRLKKESGRIIAIGDPRQAIYQFAGADSQSFYHFQQMDNTTELRLSECFRCPSSVIAFVNDTCSLDITAHSSCPLGEVRYGSYLEAETDDFILCRTNEPLVSLCFEYIRMGRKATIKGKEYGETLIALLKKVGATSLADLEVKLQKELDDYRKELLEKWLTIESVEENPRFLYLLERVETLRVFASNCQSIEEIVSKIRAIFSEATSGIILSTIHKAKGMEANKVFILFDSLTPIYHARGEQDLEQEDNLIYVSYTRCKQSLVFINDFTSVVVKKKLIDTHSKRFDAYLEKMKTGTKEGEPQVT